MKYLTLIVVFVMTQSLLIPRLAADGATSSTAQIEALINEIQMLKDASFVRNGSTYDAKTAAKFLRGKWDSHKSEITTAADFIEKAATVSSTTGKPYLIRFNDGREIKCGDFLKAKLEKLNATSPKQP
ncbi:MAG: DUF5329 domain-containing protein [Verrucomicrobia bacterium]|nr:DUF5329 domain-containing protein [Verrucomicrobiota bacterium]